MQKKICLLVAGMALATGLLAASPVFADSTVTSSQEIVTVSTSTSSNTVTANAAVSATTTIDNTKTVFSTGCEDYQEHRRPGFPLYATGMVWEDPPEGTNKWTRQSGTNKKHSGLYSCGLIFSDPTSTGSVYWPLAFTKSFDYWVSAGTLGSGGVPNQWATGYWDDGAADSRPSRIQIEYHPTSTTNGQWTHVQYQVNATTSGMWLQVHATSSALEMIDDILVSSTSTYTATANSTLSNAFSTTTLTYTTSTLDQWFYWTTTTMSGTGTSTGAFFYGILNIWQPMSTTTCEITGASTTVCTTDGATSTITVASLDTLTLIVALGTSLLAAVLSAIFVAKVWK